MVDRRDRDRRLRIVVIDDQAITLDGFHNVRRWSQALISNRRIECREVDAPYGLRAKHEGIVPLAFAVNSCLCGKTTKAVKAGFGFLLDAAIEKMDRSEVARIL